MNIGDWVTDPGMPEWGVASIIYVGSSHIQIRWWDTGVAQYWPRGNLVKV